LLSYSSSDKQTTSVAEEVCTALPPIGNSEVDVKYEINVVVGLVAAVTLIVLVVVVAQGKAEEVVVPMVVPVIPKLVVGKLRLMECHLLHADVEVDYLLSVFRMLSPRALSVRALTLSFSLSCGPPLWGTDGPHGNDEWADVAAEACGNCNGG
ncbi:hypothetical protein Tco_1461076, partial [Tanacetum coccineum]